MGNTMTYLTGRIGLLFIGLLVSCDRESGQNAVRSPAGETVALVADLTIREDFGRIVDLAVDRSGNIYAADQQAALIWRFNSAGEWLGAFGGKGEGPGEFTGLASITVARDSIFALDVRQERITAYSLEPGATSPAYSRPIPRTGIGGPQYSMMAPESGGFILQFTKPYTSESLDEPHMLEISYWGGDGDSLPHPILSLRDRQFLVTRDARYGFAVGPLPYGRYPVLRLSWADHLLAGWNDSLVIVEYDLSGQPISHVSLAQPPLPVTQADLDALLGSFGTDGFSALAREAMKKGIESDAIPSSRPAFKDFLPDERCRCIWVRPFTTDDRVLQSGNGLGYVSVANRQQEWWLVDGDGGLRRRASLPPNVALTVIDGEKAYGIQRDSLGAESIVRFTTPADSLR